jgi:hypothetical protein
MAAPKPADAPVTKTIIAAPGWSNPAGLMALPV